MENLPLSLGKEYRLTLFENRVFKEKVKIKEGVRKTGMDKNAQSGASKNTFVTKYYQHDQTKECKIRSTYHTDYTRVKFSDRRT